MTALSLVFYPSSTLFPILLWYFSVNFVMGISSYDLVVVSYYWDSPYRNCQFTNYWWLINSTFYCLLSSRYNIYAVHANGEVQNFDFLLLNILPYIATIQYSQNFWQKPKIHLSLSLSIGKLHTQWILNPWSQPPPHCYKGIKLQLVGPFLFSYEDWLTFCFCSHSVISRTNINWIWWLTLNL